MKTNAWWTCTVCKTDLPGRVELSEWKGHKVCGHCLEQAQDHPEILPKKNK